MPNSSKNRNAMVSTANTGVADDMITFECIGLNAGPFVVAELDGNEQLSAPWRFELVIEAPGASTSAELINDLVGRSARLCIPGTPKPQIFKGLIRRAMELSPAFEVRRYRILLAAEISLLGDVTSSEIYIDTSIGELIENIMRQDNPATAAYHEALGYRVKVAQAAASASRRAFLFQNNETPLAFLQHRLACEGVYYYFDQDDESSMPVFCDKLAQQPTDASELHFRSDRRYDYDDKIQTVDFFGREHRAASFVTSAGALLTRYAIPSDEKPGCIDSELKRLEQLSNDARACRTQLYLGRGRCTGVQAGYSVTIADHPLPELNATYRIIAVKHRYRRRPPYRDSNRHDSAAEQESRHYAYRSTFCALPLTLQFCSDPMADKRTPLTGVSSARIDGEGDDAFPQLDGQGRYRVKFGVGTPKEPGRASAWVRRVQARVGTAEGVHFPLRKGTEVMIAFEHGNPHLPVMLGAVADADYCDVVNDQNSQQTVLKSGAGDLIFDDSSKSQIELSTTAGRPKAASNQPGGSTLPRVERELIRLASQTLQINVGDDPGSPDTSASFGRADKGDKAAIAMQSADVNVNATEALALGTSATKSSSLAGRKVDIVAGDALHMKASKVVIDSSDSVRVSGSNIQLG